MRQKNRSSAQETMNEEEEQPASGKKELVASKKEPGEMEADEGDATIAVKDASYTGDGAAKLALKDVADTSLQATECGFDRDEGLPGEGRTARVCGGSGEQRGHMQSSSCNKEKPYTSTNPEHPGRNFRTLGHNQ